MKVSVSNWNDKNSTRIALHTRWGVLWVGGAIRRGYREVWAIYNGRPFSWQITSLRPHFALWNGKRKSRQWPTFNPDSPFWWYLAAQHGQDW